MNAKLRWSMLIIMSIVWSVSASLESIAITVDVAPEDHTTFDEFEGASHTAVAITDIPYASVKWYVDGSLKETDYGSGRKRIADFTYTFNSGSTSGRDYEIKAVAYDSQSAFGEDAYDLTVWSDLADVASRPTRSVSNEMEVGGSYAISFSLTTPNSNYRITRAEVYVDGSRVASRSFSDVTTASIAASGTLSTSVGTAVRVVVKYSWAIVPEIGKKLGGAALSFAWDAVVRGKLHGRCTCIIDTNPLDNGTFTYNSVTYNNSTTVKWDAGDRGGNKMRTTSRAGRYSFDKVPVGYLFKMIVKSTDHHRHGTGQYPTPSKCTYDHLKYQEQLGSTRWYIAGQAWEVETRTVDFPLTPDTVSTL